MGAYSNIRRRWRPRLAPTTEKKEPGGYTRCSERAPYRAMSDFPTFAAMAWLTESQKSGTELETPKTKEKYEKRIDTQATCNRQQKMRR